MMQQPRSSGDLVLADIGGTNVRFAMLSRGEVTQVEHMAVADHTQFADALAAFLARQPETKAAHRILFDVAGVVDGEYCRLTNNDWVVDGKELRASFGFTDVHLINDFEAVAWSLLALKAKDLMQHGGGAAQPDAPMLAIGPGTGFGVATYVPRAGGFVLHGEGGHATMPGGSAREDAIIALLRKEFGHVSVERVLSGQGLENLYGAISAVDGKRVAERKAPEIMQAAAADTCAVSRAAVDMFCAMLGEAAGNPMILSLIDSIVGLLREQRLRIFNVDGGPERGQFYHKRILAAIEARDPQRAREEMKAHLVQVRNDSQSFSG